MLAYSATTLSKLSTSSHFHLLGPSESQSSSEDRARGQVFFVLLNGSLLSVRLLKLRNGDTWYRRMGLYCECKGMCMLFYTTVLGRRFPPILLKCFTGTDVFSTTGLPKGTLALVEKVNQILQNKVQGRMLLLPGYVTISQYVPQASDNFLCIILFSDALNQCEY